VATTFQQALQAKNALRSKLGRPAWLRGVGVGFDDDHGCFVKVNVGEITPDVLDVLPDEVLGVKVLVEAVGEIVAQPSEERAVGSASREP
jgi:hypothetical protein